MSDKYIIKNCPAYSDYCEEIKSYECQDCTACLLKQIVELCKQYKKDYHATNGVWLLANNITNLLDIQEVE